MRRGIILLIAMILFFIADQSGLARSENMQYLERLSGDALQLAKLGRVEDVRRIIAQIGVHLEREKNVQLSTDEWRILVLSYDGVKKLVNEDEVDHDLLLSEITKFRLVVDAIATDYQPLWLDMERTVVGTVDEAIEAFRAGDKEVFRNRMDAFFQTYELLYPSLVIDVPLEKMQRVDSYVQYVKMNIEALQPSDRASLELAALQEEVRSLFEDTEEDEADPSLWWVIFTTGGIIVSTLSYVGYRKYRGEREKKRRYDRSHKY